MVDLDYIFRQLRSTGSFDDPVDKETLVYLVQEYTIFNCEEADALLRLGSGSDTAEGPVTCRKLRAYILGEEDSDVLFAKVFEACDVDGSGVLDEAELRMALRAVGYFLEVAEVRSIMAARVQETIHWGDMRSIMEEVKQRHPLSPIAAVPYAKRGISLQDLADISRVFIQSGWLKQRCQEEDLKNPIPFKRECNLYSIDQFIVRPATTPQESEASVPLDMRHDARLPDASYDTSYSELIYPEGLNVDFFVSHYWGHAFEGTLKSLTLWAQARRKGDDETAPERVVFWICLFAINQHRAADEVGAVPEQGPFNVALAKANAGVVMIVDELVNPLKRIWCLYEVARCNDFDKPFHMITEHGALDSGLDMRVLRPISNSLSTMSAQEAQASQRADKIAIWWRIADSKLKRDFADVTDFDEKVQELGPDSWSDFSKAKNYFISFNARVQGLLAVAMLNGCILSKELEGALRCCSLGAPFDPDILEGIGCDLVAERRPLAELAHSCTLLHCAARFGHLSAVGTLLAKGLPPDTRTEQGVNQNYEGATALLLAARFGHNKVVKVLLDARADTEAANKFDCTPLHLASFWNYGELADMLLSRRANPEAQMVADHRAWPGARPLHVASKSGFAGLAELLLAQRASPSAAQQVGATPLHLAAAAGHADVARALLRHGADQGLRDDEGQTPAERANGEEVAAALAEAAKSRVGHGSSVCILL